MSITDRDIRDQITRVVDAQGELGEGIDVDGITAEIVQTYGLVDVQTIGGAEFRSWPGTTQRRPDLRGYPAQRAVDRRDTTERLTACGHPGRGKPCLRAGPMRWRAEPRRSAGHRAAGPARRPSCPIRPRRLRGRRPGRGGPPVWAQPGSGADSTKPRQPPGCSPPPATRCGSPRTSCATPMPPAWSTVQPSTAGSGLAGVVRLPGGAGWLRRPDRLQRSRRER